MENKFEEMDQWMMKASRDVREQKISQKELNAFHESVMSKIMIQQPSHWSLPYTGLMFAAAFSLAIILGTVFYLHQVQVSKTEEKPVKVEVKLITAPMIPSPAVNDQAAHVTAMPQAPTPVMSQPAVSTAIPIFQEMEILEEIEALKELGVWTEEDEEEAGIPVEAAFIELENYAGEKQPSVMLSPPART